MTQPALVNGRQPVPTSRPGWQYDYSDPRGSVIQYLREQGLWNPFSAAGNKNATQLAGGLTPQWLGSLMGKTSADGSAGLGGDWADFLKKAMTGEIPSMGMDSARSNLRQISDKQGAFQRWAAGAQGADLSSPEGQKAAIEQYSNSMPDMDLGTMASLNFMNPDDQMGLYLQSMMPSLGPTFSRGLMDAMSPVKDYYESTIDPIARSSPDTMFTSLLGFLNGGAGSGAASAPSTPPMGGAQSVPPSSPSYPMPPVGGPAEMAMGEDGMGGRNGSMMASAQGGIQSAQKRPPFDLNSFLDWLMQMQGQPQGF